MQNREEALVLRRGQNWLIRRGQVFNYRLSQEGICHGFSIAARNAIVLKKLPQLVERLFLLHNHKKYDLLNKAEEAKTRLLGEIEKQKSITPNKLIDGATLIPYLNAEEQTLLSIAPLFETIELNQQYFLYRHLTKEPIVFGQQEAPDSLTFPVEMTGANNIVKLCHLHSIFSQDEITELLQSFAQSIKTEDPIAITLSSLDHSMTLQFDQTGWSFINSNLFPPPVFKFGEEAELATYILCGFSFVHPDKANTAETYVPFAISMHSNQINSEKISKDIENWLTSEKISVLTSVTSARANRLNSTGASWFALAIDVKDIAAAKKMIRDLDQKTLCVCHENVAPIFMAISSSREIVKLLLNKGIDPNSPSVYESKEFLLLAEFKGLLNPIMELINSKNSGFIPKETDSAMPLHAAIMEGDDDIVRLLLAKGADAEACFFNIEPIELALALKETQIAHTLMDYKNLMKETSKLLRLSSSSPISATSMKRAMKNVHNRFFLRQPIDQILEKLQIEINRAKGETQSTKKFQYAGLFEPANRKEKMKPANCSNDEILRMKKPSSLSRSG